MRDWLMLAPIAVIVYFLAYPKGLERSLLGFLDCFSRLRHNKVKSVRSRFSGRHPPVCRPRRWTLRTSKASRFPSCAASSPNASLAPPREVLPV